MTPVAAPPAGPLPRWLAWAFVALLALPFCPFWVDFEQVRRALLLALAGASLLLLPRLAPAVGERAGCWLLGALGASVLVNWLGQTWFAGDAEPVSFQPWEAAYRLAHWLALGVVLRLGAAAAPQGFATPLSAVLLVTSGYGLLQRLGPAAVGGYGPPAEPGSPVGHPHVAAGGAPIAAAAVAVLDPRPAWLRPAALVTAGAYLLVDGSRSGLIALPLGLALSWLLRRRTHGWLPLALAAAGALSGLGVELAAPKPAPVDAMAAKAAAKRGITTLAVRLEIAKGSTQLFAESPVFGHGPGQFAVLYPRVRSAAEIEASSQGRRFATEVRTAHDDWLELLVDGGLPALVLFAWLLFALQRAPVDRARLVPLFVLLLLMLVRSPLWNAPAVAVAVLLAGRPAPPRAGPVPRWHRVARVVLGLVLLTLGALPLLAHTFVVPYVAAVARGDQPAAAALERAIAVMPWEPRWHQLLAQERAFAGDLAAASLAARDVQQLRPYEPQTYVLLGELLARQDRAADAAMVAQHALAIDPPNPELRVLLGTALARQGEHEAAVAALVEDPHPRLREQLGTTFASLAQLARRTGDAAGDARFRVEQHFVQGLDALGGGGPASLAATGAHVRELLVALRDAGRLREDPRGYVLGALHALELGDPETAITFGEQAQKLGAPLLPWQRALLGDHTAPLRRLEVWQPLVSR